MKMLSLLLCVAIVFSFSGCTGKPSASLNSEISVSQSKEESSEGKPQSKPLKMRYVSPGSQSDNAVAVIKAVNQKLQQDGVNIEVELIRIPWDVWSDKTNLMLSTDEPFELIQVMQDFTPVSTYAGREVLLPITATLDKYPDLKAQYSTSEWNEMMVKGELYSVPARWTSFYSQDIIYYRADLMKKLNLTPPTTPDELIKVGKQLQAKFGEDKTAYLWQHQLSQTPSWLHRSYDSWPFYVDLAYGIFLVDQQGEVSSYLESETFKKDATYFERLYNEGLINPDILSLPDDMRFSEGQAGRYLFGLGTLGFENEAIVQQAIPKAAIENTFLSPEKPRLKPMLIGNSNAVPSTAENPEAGLMFLDWLYKDQANFDLFLYGLEGTHYTLTDAGRIKKIQDDTGKPLYEFDDWMIGKDDLMRHNVGDSDKLIASGKSDTYPSVTSVVSGFNFDQTKVSNQLQNVQNVIISEIYPIKWGITSYDKSFPQALKNLKAAGLDDIVAEYRAQFEIFLAAK